MICVMCVPILFADETNLFKSHQDLNHIERVLYEELKNIDLALAPGEQIVNQCKENTFHCLLEKMKCDKPIKLLIDYQAIGEVNNTKFLGVITDKKLNWKYHISYVAGKVSRAIGMVVKAKRYLKKMFVSHHIIHLFILTWPIVTTYEVQLQPIYLTWRNLSNFRTE